MTPLQPDAILFACNLNRVRSPMALGIMRKLYGGEIYVDSCGLKDPAMKALDPAADPFAREVMAEIGVDLADHRAKTFEELNDASFDLVVSLTPESQHRAVEMARGRATEIEYWPTHDPTLVEGAREARLEAYRQVRDGLIQRITERFRR